MDDILTNEEENILNVNQQYCIGCGVCNKISPETFVMNNKKAEVIRKILNSEENENIKASIDKCPAKAIGYKKIV